MGTVQGEFTTESQSHGETHFRAAPRTTYARYRIAAGKRGFGLIALDLCDLPTPTARRIPLTTWFRFRRAVEHTPTVLIAFERQSIAGSCSSLLIKLGAAGKRKKEQPMNCETKPTHANLLTEIEITAEIVRSRVERKPAASVAATFASKTAWAG